MDFKLFFTLFLLLSAFTLSAQNLNIEDLVGLRFSITSKNRKGKIISVQEFEYAKVDNENVQYIVKGVDDNQIYVEFKRNGNNFLIESKWLLFDKNLQGKNVNVGNITMDGAITYPDKFEVGQRLQNDQVKVNSEGAINMSTKAEVFDRKVIGKEMLPTFAGQKSCYIIEGKVRIFINSFPLAKYCVKVYYSPALGIHIKEEVTNCKGKIKETKEVNSTSDQKCKKLDTSIGKYTETRDLDDLIEQAKKNFEISDEWEKKIKDKSLKDFIDFLNSNEEAIKHIKDIISKLKDPNIDIAHVLATMYRESTGVQELIIPTEKRVISAGKDAIPIKGRGGLDNICLEKKKKFNIFEAPFKEGIIDRIQCIVIVEEEDSLKITKPKSLEKVKVRKKVHPGYIKIKDILPSYIAQIEYSRNIKIKNRAKAHSNKDNNFPGFEQSEREIIVDRFLDEDRIDKHQQRLWNQLSFGSGINDALKIIDKTIKDEIVNLMREKYGNNLSRQKALKKFREMNKTDRENMISDIVRDNCKNMNSLLFNKYFRRSVESNIRLQRGAITAAEAWIIENSVPALDLKSN